MAGARGRPRRRAGALGARGGRCRRVAPAAVARDRGVAAARRGTGRLRPAAGRLPRRSAMARRAAALLTWALCAGPAAAQLRMVEVPIAGRTGIDSLARLGFEVAGVREVDGAL